MPLRIDMGSDTLIQEMKALGSGDVNKCYQCGTCVGDCPAIRLDLHVRRLMKYSIYGLEEQVLNDRGVWGCTTCHQCSERCPEGASPYELVMAVRRFQSKDGKLPSALKRIARNILEFGHSVDLQDKHRKARAAVGLPEQPPTIISHPELLEELRRIVDGCGITEIIAEGGEG